MDVWKNKENSLKTPWKCTSKVLEKSLKKVCHDLWEPWLRDLVILHETMHAIILLIRKLTMYMMQEL